MNVFLRNARARNGHVEATLNHPFPAQVVAPASHAMVAHIRDHADLSDLHKMVYAHHFLPICPSDDGHLNKTPTDTRVAFDWLTGRTAKATTGADLAAQNDKQSKDARVRIRKGTGERVYLIDEPPAHKKRRTSS